MCFRHCATHAQVVHCLVSHFHLTADDVLCRHSTPNDWLALNRAKRHPEVALFLIRHFGLSVHDPEVQALIERVRYWERSELPTLLSFFQDGHHASE